MWTLNFEKRFKRYFNFCPDFYDHVGKRLDKKANVSLKIPDVTDCTTNNQNTDVVQYLKKQGKQ